MKKTEFHGKLPLVPENPGVYMFKKSDGEILYIGKANNLKKRIQQYFGREPETRMNISLMMRKVADFETIVTNSEVEALILEANLVHEHKPHYNMRLKDDKYFPYIRVTVQELYPGLYVTRNKEKDGARYFGPYTDSKAMRRTLSFLQKTFHVRDCKKNIRAGKPERPCLYYQIRRCQGVCTGEVSQQEYANRVERVCDFLAGKSMVIAEDIKRKMEEAAAREEYEHAAEFRDQYLMIEKVIEKQRMDMSDAPVSRDIFSFVERGETGCAVVIRVREGLVLDRQHFILQLSKMDEEGVGPSFLTQYYTHQDQIPSEILLPVEIPENALFEGWLSKKRGGTVKILFPKRGEKVRLLKLAQKNAELKLIEELGKQQVLRGSVHPAVSALQRELGLKKLPRRIEGFDISHLMGTDTVASMVLFFDAKPQKKEYRHYKIEDIQKPDDFASMHQVVTRRMRRLKEEGKERPDLLLIDGGKGQLSAASKALKEQGIKDQAVIALAKRLDEVFLPGRKDSVMIQKTSPAIKLIQRIRDEAHRFGLSYQKIRRGKRVLASPLDTVKGIGTVRKEKLLRKFGSVKRIKAAGVDEIAKVVGEKVAVAVMKGLGEKKMDNGQWIMEESRNN